MIMFSSPNDFSKHIETLRGDTDATLLETILQFCEDSGVDPDEVVPLISKSLREKIGIEAGKVTVNSLDGF